MAEYLDKTGLTKLWTKIKDYIANNAVVPSDITGNAGTATKLKTSRSIDGINFDGMNDIKHYGVCELGETYANKPVTIPNFSLIQGAKVSVLFLSAIATSNSALNVSSTGPRPIYYKGFPLPAGYVKANTVLNFVYDGVYWQVLGDLTEKRLDTIESTYARKTDNVASATKLQTARTIDGVTFDGSTARSHYGICSTSAGTTAKTVSITGFTLVTGARVTVRFTYANTASNITLNVSGTGAKAIYYKNTTIPASYIKAYSLLELVYDGSYWRVVGDLTQSQVETLNTNLTNIFEDITDQFNWGSCMDYKAYKAGKIVFFQARCTTKSASQMTVVTLKNSTLYPKSITPLTCRTVAGADHTKRAIAYVNNNAITLNTYSSYTSVTQVALTGDVIVYGMWFLS